MEENLSLPETIPELCIVCGTPTAILHFQLNVCRACAAFYRRSLDKHHLYKCQKLTGKCDVTIKLLISAAMSATSLSQKLAIAGIGTKFMTKATLDVPIGILATALGNNLAAFVNQMVEMYVNYQDAGKTRERIFQRGYKMIDMFMTQKRVYTIYCRIKKAFDTKDATWWPFIKSNLGTQIKFSTLDGLGTCV
uniref:Nuclear receptor domain-containing protein n=1 Tax=Panagrolaimus sp. PS1159 TaxID=55785 RepID=A0AC35FIP0_9BILA